MSNKGTSQLANEVQGRIWTAPSRAHASEWKLPLAAAAQHHGKVKYCNCAIVRSEVFPASTSLAGICELRLS